jgi:CBS domain containing-hemolysin-like protein
LSLIIMNGLGILALAVVTALVAILAAMLERSGPIRLRHWAEEAGGGLLGLFGSPVRFEVFRYLLSWLAKLLPLALFLAVWSAFRSLATDRVVLLSAGVAVAAVLGLSEMLSRAFVGRDPEEALRRLTPVYRTVRPLLLPVVALLAPLFPASMVQRLDDEDEVTDDEIEAFLPVGTQEGILEPGEEDLIARVIDFGDTLVKSVVTPRIDMVCAPADSDLETLAALFLESKHSRIPIYESSVDQVVGVLHIRDLLEGLRADKLPVARDLAMPPYFVPETKPLNELLEEFKAQHQQLAVVVDEYGGTSGMVTVEDLLEEIVGDIQDEHDEAVPINESLPDGRWRIDGGASLETLEELFAAEVEEEPYETVGGLIFGLLGYVPEPGERLESHGLSFQVERVENRRVRSVLVGAVTKNAG